MKVKKLLLTPDYITKKQSITDSILDLPDLDDETEELGQIIIASWSDNNPLGCFESEHNKNVINLVELLKEEMELNQSPSN